MNLGLVDETMIKAKKLILKDFGEKTVEANLSSITPKGLDIPAQGSALGSEYNNWPALKGRYIMRGLEYVTPFQGFFPCNPVPRALPWAGM